MTAAMFSGGLSSFLACTRIKPDVLLFSDTGVEDEDLYRFVRESAEYLGVTLMELSSDESFNQMIVRHNALPSDRMPFCSSELKASPAVEYLKMHGWYSHLLFGLDWTEPHRLKKVQKRWPGYTILAPMMDPPYLTKKQMAEQVRSMGIEPPRLYAQGFAHNNCGGGCVRNGLAAWRHLLKVNPERYEEWATRESLIQGHSFARDRTGGESKPITLRELARREESQLDLFDWGGCGCFTDEEAEG